MRPSAMRIWVCVLCESRFRGDDAETRAAEHDCETPPPLALVSADEWVCPRCSRAVSLAGRSPGFAEAMTEVHAC